MTAANAEHACQCDKRMLGPRMAMKAIAAAPAATASSQLLRMGRGSAVGPQGISVPCLNQFVAHKSPEVPPNVDAAAEIRIMINPLGFSAPAMHIKIPPAE